jgi:hypothetical protein
MVAAMVVPAAGQPRAGSTASFFELTQLYHDSIKAG